MNKKKTKVTKTEITEILDIETDSNEAVSEAEFEECCRYDCEADFAGDYDIDDTPTPLQQGYCAWIKRKQREKLYGKDTTKETNIFEELVYRCLQHCS